MKTEIDQIWNQKRRKKRKKRKRAWKNNAKVVEWFGADKVRNSQIRKVRRRVKKIEKRLRKKKVKYVYHHDRNDKVFGRRPCLGTARAHTISPLPGNRFEICENFPASKDKSRAGIIIHEFIHEIRISGKHHGVSPPDREQSARELAKNKPKKARKSPYNYQFFSKTYDLSPRFPDLKAVKIENVRAFCPPNGEWRTDATIVVENIGEGDSDNFYIEVNFGTYSDDLGSRKGESKVVRMKGIRSGEKRRVWVPGSFCFYPDCNISIRVDVNNIIRETDEGNNSFSIIKQNPINSSRRN